MMAEAALSPPLPAKKARCSAPMAKVSPEAHTQQFKNNLYVSSGVLFCRHCNHSIDIVRVDTIKDHIKSKKQMLRKNAKEASLSVKGPEKQQTTLTSMVKSQDLREEFVLDFVKVYTMADIPLEKVDKRRPFLQKYSKQSGALPQISALRRIYVLYLPKPYYN